MSLEVCSGTGQTLRLVAYLIPALGESDAAWMLLPLLAIPLMVPVLPRSGSVRNSTSYDR